MKTITVIDDEEPILALIRRTLERPDWQINTYTDPLQALSCLSQLGSDLVIIDLKMPQANGIDVLRRCRVCIPDAKVVILTGYGQVQDAVQAMKAGAADFLTKPVHTADLRSAISKLLELQDAARSGKPSHNGESPVTSSRMAQVYALADAVGVKDTPVLITGETGVGKEVLSDYIQRHSSRANAPYIKVNCAAMPETLIDSELFGHERGAFTGAADRRIGRFELANRGTVFLDEIAELSVPLQAKLLRVLQSHEIERVGGESVIHVDFRLICASNREFPALVKAGSFREDLFYRINVFPIHIPSLRERPEDIAALAEAFLYRARHVVDRERMAISLQAQALLNSYAWPGNVRELENAIERATITASGPVLTPDDFWWLNCAQAEPAPSAVVALRDDQPASQQEAFSGKPLEQAERNALVAVLGRHNWCFSRAAAELKVSRSTLYAKAKRYAIARQAR
jgi:DNA-binding NtrC family response regulator